MNTFINKTSQNTKAKIVCLATVHASQKKFMLKLVAQKTRDTKLMKLERDNIKTKSKQSNKEINYNVNERQITKNPSHELHKNLRLNENAYRNKHILTRMW